MPETYGLDCPLARTLDIVGVRWSVLVLRDLFLQGPRKFQDFQNSLSGIGPNILSARLKRLEEAGIVERRFYAEHPPPAFAPSYRNSTERSSGGELGMTLMAGEPFDECESSPY